MVTRRNPLTNVNTAETNVLQYSALQLATVAAQMAKVPAVTDYTVALALVHRHELRGAAGRKVKAGNEAPTASA